MIETLTIFLHDQAIGMISHHPGDRNLFTFLDVYVNNLSRPTLSISYKDTYGELITDTKATRTRLSPFFSNLLPEGHMRTYLASQADVNPEREFFLLKALGQDLPGAIKVLPSGEIPLNLAEHSESSVEEDRDTTLHFSLAGIQLKFSAILERDGGLTVPAHGVGGSWIIKLPSAIYRGVPENEFIMMELARQIGIDIPETNLMPMDQIHNIPRGISDIGSHVFAIKRFDRDLEKGAVHIEDFAQVFGIYPEKKYQAASYRNIAEVIWREIGDEGIIEFVRRFVFNALIGNGDMHLKNWSLIYYDGKKPSLAPGYDFLSTIPYLPNDKLALNFVDSKEFSSLTMEQFRRFAAKAQLPEAVVLDTVAETVKSFAKVWKSVDDYKLDRHIKETIASHLKSVPIYRSL